MPIFHEGRHIVIAVSIGVANLGFPTADLPSLLQVADRALYQAKANGRNRVEMDRRTLSPDAIVAGG